MFAGRFKGDYYVTIWWHRTDGTFSVVQREPLKNLISGVDLFTAVAVVNDTFARLDPKTYYQED